jgi:hypothetical protein
VALPGKNNYGRKIESVLSSPTPTWDGPWQVNGLGIVFSGQGEEERNDFSKQLWDFGEVILFVDRIKVNT